MGRGGPRQSADRLEIGLGSCHALYPPPICVREVNTTVPRMRNESGRHTRHLSRIYTASYIEWSYAVLFSSSPAAAEPDFLPLPFSFSIMVATTIYNTFGAAFVGVVASSLYVPDSLATDRRLLSWTDEMSCPSLQHLWYPLDAML